MRARVALLTVTGPPRMLLDVEAARRDIVDAGGVDDFVTEEDEESEELKVMVELADD